MIAIATAGTESSSSSTVSVASMTSQKSSDYTKASPKSRASRPPPSRKASFNPNAMPARLDTIPSDGSAEALAQHASTKSSNASASASAASSQLTHATAIIDLALKDSVSNSGNHSGRLPSLLLSKELDDVPFSTRLQTVIEGLGLFNSPSKEGSTAAQPNVLLADGTIAIASLEAKNKSYFSPFAADAAAELL